MNMTRREVDATRKVHVGMDVHKETIAAAVAWTDGETGELAVEELGIVSNRASQVDSLVVGLEKSFGRGLKFVYEAGPCGYALHRALTAMGHECCIAAPTMIPKRSGDRVKTDRRDARELARMSAFGLLTPIWVPDAAQESLRELARCRMSLKDMIGRERKRIQHFLLRRNLHPPKKVRAWSESHRSWLKDLELGNSGERIALRCHLDVMEDLERRLGAAERDLAHEVDVAERKFVIDELRALRGVDRIVAVALLAEVGDLRRFPSARCFMSYLGLTPSEHSSGGRRRTGAITKTGNSRLRRLLVESAWTYRHPARDTKHLQRKAADASRYARDRAWEAQKDLCRRYRDMVERGKNTKTINIAVARGLAGFVWDIGRNAMSRLHEERRETA